DDLVTGVQTCALPIYSPTIVEAEPFSWPKASLAAAARLKRFSMRSRMNCAASTLSGITLQVPTMAAITRYESALAAAMLFAPARSEERRVGQALRLRW